MSVLAFDLGATSGRALIGQFDGEQLTVEEIQRFSNDPVQVGDRLQWDILRLLHELKQGMLQAKHRQPDGLRSLAIDSWAVDFGLLGSDGELLGNPYHYRDHHTDGIMEELFAILPRQDIFRRTGIQFLQFNTLFQLFAMKQAGSPLLEQAKHLLMIPDLLRYFLTGERYSEFTNATTTQLYHPLHLDWDQHLLDTIGVSRDLFADVLNPGSPAGSLRPSIQTELGLGSIPVLAVAEHDTGSAVASIPAIQPDFAYLICGTWSLMGTEVTSPVLSDEALSANFTNEGGVNQTFRLLKNIMGLWIFEECRRAWVKEGQNLSYGEMIAQAEQAEPFRSLIDPDHPAFLNPEHMPKQIAAYCRETNQPVPDDVGSMIRCVLESLALKYRAVLELTEQITGKSYSGLHMVGGGIKNKLLCRYTASAIGKPVWAGPEEGSAIGNILVQYMSLGELDDIWQAREVVRRSFPMELHEPADTEQWNEAYERFVQIEKRMR